MEKYRKKIRVFAAALTALLCLLLSACASKVTEDGEDYSRYTYRTFQTTEFFGTNATLTLGADFRGDASAEKAEATWAKIKELLGEIEHAIGAYEEGGDVARFNALPAGGETQIGAIAYDVLSQAMRLYELTEGAFNPAVGLSADLWGFSPRFAAGGGQPMPYDREHYERELPAPEYVAAFARLSDFSQVEISEREGVYFAKKPDLSERVNGADYTVRLDFGGIGKGYAADRVAELLVEAGYRFGYFGLGGSSIAVGKALDGAKGGGRYDWKVSVVHPRAAGNYMDVPLSDVFVSTSGDYERYYTVDGIAYCHIIDAATGAPMRSDIVSATIIGASACEADALSTALCVMGSERAAAFAAAHKADVRIAFVADGKLYTTLSQDAYRLTADIVFGGTI